MSRLYDLFLRIARWLVGRPSAPPAPDYTPDTPDFVVGTPVVPGVRAVPFEAARAEPHCPCPVCVGLRDNDAAFLAAGFTWNETVRCWERP